jgi:toxin secretion/phage lysis holin
MKDKMMVSAMKAAGAAFAAGITAIFGRWDMLMTVLVVMVTADYVTGMIAAAIKGELDSRIGLRGILKKLMLFAAVAVAAAADTLSGMEGHPIRAAACLFYVGNEAVSILENVAAAGVPIPAKVAALFHRLKDE